ncbi:uncharacterized protein LOC128997656 [Macrosteles quadrilineatus]|uniref:uncharacterized protein LOC128997656 n=1 Tax=Macrosteles quadrilineatus TaxID=74068 RepID=UPI0023E22426|nr:uncharacterized protein LOC128997656 [Macrosteles quadrilineatus]
MTRVTNNRRRGVQWGLRERLDYLDFADDLCLIAQRYTDIQAKLSSLQREAEEVGLKINVNKTKEMTLNSRGAQVLELNGKVIEEAGSFQYLGSKVTADGGAKEDVRSRIGKANAAFIQLYPIWCLRRLKRVFWPNTISNEQLWEATRQQKISLEIKRQKWRWLGHTLRKTDGAIEKKALEWNPQGTRKRGRPCDTWRRTIMKEALSVGKTWGLGWDGSGVGEEPQSVSLPQLGISRSHQCYEEDAY